QSSVAALEEWPSCYAFMNVYLEGDYADVVSAHWINSGSAWNNSGSLRGDFTVGSDLVGVSMFDSCSNFGSATCNMGVTADIYCQSPDGGSRVSGHGYHF